MAVSNTDSALSLYRPVRSLSRYDLVLVAIPAVFVLALLTAHALPVALSTAMAAASVVGGLAVADALFVNPPCRS